MLAVLVETIATSKRQLSLPLSTRLYEYCLEVQRQRFREEGCSDADLATDNIQRGLHLEALAMSRDQLRFAWCTVEPRRHYLTPVDDSTVPAEVWNETLKGFGLDDVSLRRDVYHAQGSITHRMNLASPAAMAPVASDDDSDGDDAADLFFHDDYDYDFRAGY